MIMKSDATAFLWPGRLAMATRQFQLTLIVLFAINAEIIFATEDQPDATSNKASILCEQYLDRSVQFSSTLNCSRYHDEQLHFGNLFLEDMRL